MSDLFAQVGKSDQAHKLVRRLGLPIALPRELRRANGPLPLEPLADHVVAVGGGPGSSTSEIDLAIATTLLRAGARPHVAGPALPTHRQIGEVLGRRVAALDLTSSAKLRFDALVFDATGLNSASELAALYEFFQPLLHRLRVNGRVALLGRPPASAASARRAAAQGALEGFMRSVAKEIGRHGSTAHLLIIDPGAETRIEAVLRFVLSQRSAFVSGQPISVSELVPSSAQPPWQRPLANRVALVTGAARGIGQATARLLAEEGAHVVCLDRPQDEAQARELAASIAGSLLCCDVSERAAPETIARHLKEQHGGVDIVVHNAGVTRDRSLSRMARAEWDLAIAVNLAAVCSLDEALSRGLLRDFGRIICLSSVSGIAGNFGQSNYAAAKAGILAYVRQQAKALAARGITVNAVAPGFIETRMTSTMPAMIRQAGRRLSALGQGGLPRDVADVITFLATPGAVGITGAVLRVCGGALIGA